MVTGAADGIRAGDDGNGAGPKRASPVLATVIRDNTPAVSSSSSQNPVAVTTPGVPDVLLLTSQAAGGFQVGVAASSGSGAGGDALVTVKPVVDVAVPDTAPVNYNIGVDTFNATNPQAIVHLTATLSDGRPLPDWLAFDPRTGSLSGEPPANQAGLVDVLITARDTEGHEATAHVKIELGNHAVGPQGTNAAPDRHADAGIRHLHVADAVDAVGRQSVLLRDPKPDLSRTTANQSLSAQIKSAHAGRRLLQQASLFCAAEQMLRRA